MKHFPLLENYWSKVEKTNSCWNWTASTNQKGYGRIGLWGLLIQTHRLAYQLKNGMIPKDMTVDHLCRNRRCVNPDHLEAVTNRENIMRGEGICSKFAKQTHCKRGHPLTRDNIYSTPGRRNCVTCARERGRNQEAKAKIKRRLLHPRRFNNELNSKILEDVE